ncbi:MAG: hypothetical protein EA374_08245 [Acholeplasmatales bacterium]|nr:MAG: hypothetical protein EA374_08245 [Acholeplasmatales bacterium]
MKKFLSMFALMMLAFVMVACGDDEEPIDDTVTLPETISMTELDQYLFQPDWQFVDLRNFDDQMADGWIRGFEIIPFFQYLEYENILIRTDGWNFDGSQIINESALRELFDEDRNIVMICAAGVRSAFVKEALKELGYENVWNAGALGNYVGDHRVFGDGSFKISLPPRAWVDPLPEEITMDNIDLFLGRPGAKFFDFRDVYPGESAPMLEIGWIAGVTVIPYFGFLANEEVEVINHPGTFNLAEIDLEEVINDDMIYVLENLFGDKDTELILMCMSGARSGLMKAVLEEIGYTNVWNAGGWMNYEGNNKVLPWCTGGSGDNGDENGGCE